MKHSSTALIVLAVVMVSTMGACQSDTRPAGTDGDWVQRGPDGAATDTAADQIPRDGRWRNIGSFGDTIRSFEQLHGITYATVGADRIRKIYRSEDGGENWEPIGSSGLDAIVGETIGESDVSVETTEIADAQYASIGDKLYRNTEDASWSTAPLELPMAPIQLTSVGDRLVILYRAPEGDPPHEMRLAFSDDGGRSWKTERSHEAPVSVRAWEDQLVLITFDEGGYDPDFHWWQSSTGSWSVDSSPGRRDVWKWRRVDGRFYAVDSSTMKVSEDGREWTKHELDPAAPPVEAAFEAPDVLPDGTDRSAVLVAVGIGGEVGTLDETGQWTRLTAGGPHAPRDAEATGRGLVVNLRGGLPFHWSATGRTWTTLTITDRRRTPERMALTSSGRLVAVADGEVFSARGSEWAWRPEARGGRLSHIFRLEDDTVIGVAGPGCLRRQSGPSDTFTPYMDDEAEGDGHADEGCRVRWHPSVELSAFVEGDEAMYFGLDPSDCPGRGTCRGGLHRRAPGDREYVALTDETLRAEDMPPPPVRTMAYHDGRLWVAGPHGLAVSEDGGSSWASASNTLRGWGRGEIEDLELREMTSTDEHLFARFGPSDGEGAGVVAVRGDEMWHAYEGDLDGALHDLAATADHVYVATDRGVFVDDAESSWKLVEGELPEQSAVEVRVTHSASAVTFADGETWRRLEAGGD